MNGFIMPDNSDYERILLACCVYDTAALYLSGKLSDDDFYTTEHRKTWAVITVLLSAGGEVEPDALIKTGASADFVHNLADTATTRANLDYYVQEVRKCTMRRNIILQCDRAINLALNDTDPMETMCKLETGLNGRLRASGAKSVISLLCEVTDDLEKASESGVMGIKTGVKALDDCLSGLAPHELTVLAARPSMGKTALALQIGFHASRMGATVLVLSLEMSAKALVLRELCSTTGVSMHKARAGQMSKEDQKEMAKGPEIFGNLMIYVDDEPAITPYQARSKALSVKHSAGLDLIIVDYIQLMQSDKKCDNRQGEVSAISQGLKQMAKTLDCHVLALSQLSRACEARTDKRPMLSDLRESGAIEQDADNVVFIYRDGYYNKGGNQTTSELIVAKQRNGPTGKIDVGWNQNKMRFTNEEDWPHD